VPGGSKLRLLALAVTLAGLVGCSAVSRGDGDHGPTRSPRSTRAASAPAPVRARGGPPTHVAVIVMENKEYGSIIGSRQAPFITRLASRYALAEAMYAVSHPSLPNYLALTGGSTFGIASDCTSCAVNASSLVTQLEAAGISWKAYMEGLPHPCFRGATSDDYAKKHDPFAYFRSVVARAASCRRIVPFSQLAADERARALPRFIWITPNLCHDMHSCSVATGDRFLADLIPSLLPALGRGGLLFLTWDEGSSDSGCCRVAAGGHIVTIVGGPGARRGARLTTPADHYSVLQTIEDVLGLPRLRYAACACTPSLRPLLTGG
jgi:hypothetical protein